MAILQFIITFFDATINYDVHLNLRNDVTTHTHHLAPFSR